MSGTGGILWGIARVVTSRAVGLALTVSLVHLAFYTSKIYIYLFFF